MGIFNATKAAIVAVFITMLVATSVSGAAIRSSSMLAKLQKPVVFSQTGIKLHSAASDKLESELQEQLMQKLNAQIQEKVHAFVSEMVASEVMKSEELDFKKGAKSIFDDLLTKALSKAKVVVSQSCTKLGDVARQKLREVDEKLEEIASEGAPSAPSQIQLSQSAVDQAFSEIQQQMMADGWWDDFKSGAKRAFKKVAGHVKGIVKGFAEAAKPMLAKAASDFMPMVQGKIDDLLGGACDYVQGQIKNHQTVLEEGEA